MKSFLIYLISFLLAFNPAFAGTGIVGPALIEGVTVTTTAAGTTTLTKDSQTVQTFIGSTTQTVTLPDATTLPVGRYFEFYNLSSGAVTVNANGGTLQRTLAAIDHSKITLTANSTAAGAWAVEKITISLTDSLLTGTLPLSKGGTGQTSFGTGILHSNGSVLSSSAVSLTADVSGTLPIANGGTGQVTATAAFDALAPSQGSNSGKFLTTNGTTTSWGVAGLSTQGQSESPSVTTTSLLAPNYQLTTTGTNTRLIETGNKNILRDPSFEALSMPTDWLGSGTFDNTETTNCHGDGLKCLKTTVTSALTTSLVQTQTPLGQFGGANWDASAWIKTTGSNLVFRSFDAGVTIQEIPILGDGLWHQYVSTWGVSGTGAIGWGVRSLSGTGQVFYTDDTKVEPSTRVGTVQQATFWGGMEQPGNTCDHLESTSSGLTNFVDLTTSGTCSPWTVTPGGTGTVAAVGTNDHRLTATNMQPGMYEISIAGTLYVNNAGVCTVRLSDGTNTYQPQSVVSPSGAAGGTPNLIYHVPYTSPQSSVTFKLQASDQGTSCGFLNSLSGTSNMAWKIKYFPSQSQQAIRMDQSNYDWRAYTPTFTGFGTVSNVECQEKREGPDNLIRCKYTTGTHTATEARVSLPGGNVSAGTSIIPSLQVAGFGSNSSTSNASMVMLIEPSVGYLTFGGLLPGTYAGLSKANANSPWNNSITMSFFARVPIAGWSENQNAPLLVGGVTSSSLGMDRIESAKIETSGSGCTIFQDGNWLTSCVRNSTGSFTVTVNTGIWPASTIPRCSIVPTQTVGGDYKALWGTKTNTSLPFYTRDASGLVDGLFVDIICKGQR